MGNAEASGHGGARRYLGFTTVTTDGVGNANFNVLVNTWVNAGDTVTATATVDLGGGTFGSTSEFGSNVTATSSGVIVVNTNSDVNDGTTTSLTNLAANRGADGRISLREAIIAANNTTNGASPDVIAFDILALDTVTISVTSSNLDTITQAVTINATSQYGFNGSPLISLVNGDTRTYGFDISGNSSTIRGFSIQGFDTAGINITGSSNTIAGNYIGTNLAGTAAAANALGVNIWSGDNNVIGGTTTADRNIISGNSDNGITITGSADNTLIYGNYIGTDATGSYAIRNTNNGIYVGSSVGTRVGSGTSGAANVISGNGNGVTFDNADNSFIQGNYIGLAVNGSTSVANVWNGVQMLAGSSGNLVGTNADGSNDTAERNIISNNLNGSCFKVLVRQRIPSMVTTSVPT